MLHNQSEIYGIFSMPQRDEQKDYLPTFASWNLWIFGFSLPHRYGLIPRCVMQKFSWEWCITAVLRWVSKLKTWPNKTPLKVINPIGYLILTDFGQSFWGFHSLNDSFSPHTSALRASCEVSFVSYMKNGRDISKAQCVRTRFADARVLTVAGCP